MNKIIRSIIGEFTNCVIIFQRNKMKFNIHLSTIFLLMAVMLISADVTYPNFVESLHLAPIVFPNDPTTTTTTTTTTTAAPVLPQYGYYYGGVVYPLYPVYPVYYG